MSSLSSAQNQTSKTPRLKVAICGGGVAGLVLAVALSKHDDIEVKMYEAAECFKEIGAGVTIWGRAFDILARMGLDHDMRLAEDVPTDGMHDPTFDFDMRKSDQPEEGFMWHPLRLPYKCIYFHRARFLDVLVKHYPTGIAHFRKRLSTYTQLDSGVITLGFADGTSATCDVLLGCDGIRSAVRREMYEKEAVVRGQPGLLKHVEPVFSGSIVYRTLIPAELLTAEDGLKHPAMCAPKMYCGRDKHIVTYPVAGGSVCNFAAVTTDRDAIGQRYDGPWMSECSAQEVMDCYTNWEPQAQDLINHIHPRKPMKWAIHEVFPVPFSAAGNVALVGDAAHAMVPFQGAGAGQAIEDAYILAGLLAHPSTTRQTVSRALKAYEFVRLPLAKHVQEGSRKSGHISELDVEYGDDYERLARDYERQWDWVCGPDPHSELERAVDWCYPTESVRAQL